VTFPLSEDAPGRFSFQLIAKLGAMYKKYFHLIRNPFDLTPDPRCFVSTFGHDEALAALYYGVRWRKGFVVLTGEVGTGKTLLLRCLLRLLEGMQDIACAYVFNGRLSPTEFLQYILSGFGLPGSGKNKGELLVDLSQFLVSRGSKGFTTILIVDEAHHLSDGILDHIRLLSELEPRGHKLLQILLVGQPELDIELNTLALRQLKERIGIRAQLAPLDADDTQRYIDTRLRIAGREPCGEPIFPPEAVSAVYRHSGGIPRLINTICENALIVAYARQYHAVTKEIIEDIAREFRLDMGSRDSKLRNKVMNDGWGQTAAVTPAVIHPQYPLSSPSNYASSNCLNLSSCVMGFCAGIALAASLVLIMNRRAHPQPMQR
jgi:general secretion pathway protein A